MQLVNVFSCPEKIGVRCGRGIVVVVYVTVTAHAAAAPPAVSGLPACAGAAFQTACSCCGHRTTPSSASCGCSSSSATATSTPAASPVAGGLLSQSSASNRRFLQAAATCSLHRRFMARPQVSKAGTALRTVHQSRCGTRCRQDSRSAHAQACIWSCTTETCKRGAPALEVLTAVYQQGCAFLTVGALVPFGTENMLVALRVFGMVQAHSQTLLLLCCFLWGAGSSM